MAFDGLSLGTTTRNIKTRTVNKTVRLPDEVRYVREEIESGLTKKDYIIQGIILLMTFGMLMGKLFGTYYGDPNWKNMDWVWVVSPLWITYSLSLFFMFVFKMFGEKL